MEECNEIT